MRLKCLVITKYDMWLIRAMLSKKWGFQLYGEVLIRAMIGEYDMWVMPVGKVVRQEANLLIYSNPNLMQK